MISSALRPRVVSVQRREQLPDCAARLRRMSDRALFLDAVAVSPPDPLTVDVPAVDQVAEDAVCLTLGDAGDFGDFAHRRVRPGRDLEQDEAM